MWVIGIVVVVLALVALAVWVRSFRQRYGGPEHEVVDEQAPPASERDTTWDPRERYE